MILSIKILTLVLSFSFTQRIDSKTKLDVKMATSKIELSDMLYFTKNPDSLELMPNKKLVGDFNGDGKTDYASLVKNKKNEKVGVLIAHNSIKQEFFVFGAGKKAGNTTDLSWIEVFKTLPKGEIVSPTIVDPETGDILGQDESKNFKLIGDGIYMSVEESHGGGIIFWNGKGYQWYHIE